MKNELKERCTIWKATYLFCKQYRCFFALFFKSVISSIYNVVIDRMIQDPRHGNDMVDGINACGKRYLMGEICMIDTTEVDNRKSRMNIHSIIGISSCNLFKECKRLCEDNERVNSVKVYGKNKKWEANTKLKKTLYHVQDKYDVEIAGTKKEEIRLQKRKPNGISLMYNIR